jgi:hypothetical protein
MSEAGKLTAETMIKAFEKMAASNADLLKKQGVGPDNDSHEK